MAQAQATVKQSERRGPFLNGSGISRRWDLLLVVSAVFIIIAAMHLKHELLVGDWDFWADWKDRQWWPTLTPLVYIIIPSAVQYIVWTQLRLPVGATICTLLLLIGHLVSRSVNFAGWAYIPFNFVMPAQMVPAGVVLDVVLMATNSFIYTSIIGSMAWGLMFQAINAPIFGQYWQPVNYKGTILTVADVMGFQNTRVQTPAYLRIVEQGHFRAFLSQISYVVALFSGFISIAGYWAGQFIGRVLAVNPATQWARKKRWMEPQDEIAVQAPAIPEAVGA